MGWEQKRQLQEWDGSGEEETGMRPEWGRRHRNGTGVWKKTQELDGSGEEDTGMGPEWGRRHRNWMGVGKKTQEWDLSGEEDTGIGWEWDQKSIPMQNSNLTATLSNLDQFQQLLPIHSW